MSDDRAVAAWQPWAALAMPGFVLNFVWEMLQMPLYGGYLEEPYWEGTKRCVQATGGDVAILLAAYALVAAVSGRFWLKRADHLAVVAFVACGVAATIAFEVVNVHLLGRWSYAASMPTIAGIGVAPLLQWVLLPPLVLWIAHRHLVRAGR